MSLGHNGVVLFTDSRDWHLRRLRRAFAAHGIEPVVVTLREVAFDLDHAEPIRIRGFEGGLPRAVLVRGIAAGSFEAITLRLGILHALEAVGVTVWNSARAIERCVDKSTASLILARKGIRTPSTFVSESREAAMARLEAEGAPMVLKPLFGSQGKGIRLLTAGEEFPSVEEVGGVYYLQRYIRPRDGLYRDYRLFVSGGRLVDAMCRESESWITNVHQGGRPCPWDPPLEVKAMAVAAVEAIGARFAGVDMIEDDEGGFQVLEVNSMPAWKGLSAVARVDVAEALVSDFLDEAGLGRRSDEPGLALAGQS
ncbi:Alpha-aminoadipate-LysW ligase LysX [Hartmannibacter diazotrophicus]|uniref:Alpha-aminoadipate-LysW ligase LysX n=1 Tax=Hartmannibacter diazotrophicus TaxID=1482074 RepID=A0A2C9D6A7_9HYPH|nr:RimK family alpha-L-glutamate ligase [Hartmannibacter diazotrophicus]SON55854.1 Alpha-aminoadipate-LysW ligase LysX [Hartmannibacter diazotrophicus]